MESSANQGIPEERITNRDEYANILAHVTCSICQNILWKPVSCTSCQKSFCKECIHKWLAYQRGGQRKCPVRCTYEEAGPNPLLISLLSQLKISCCYKDKGCQEAISYEGLEKHQMNCPFSPRKCQGCKALVLQKNLSEHEEMCEFVKRICNTCRRMFTKRELINHTPAACHKIVVKKKDEEIAFLESELQNSKEAIENQRQDYEENIKSQRQGYEETIKSQRQNYEEAMKRLEKENHDLKEKLTDLEKKPKKLEKINDPNCQHVLYQRLILTEWDNEPIPRRCRNGNCRGSGSGGGDGHAVCIKCLNEVCRICRVAIINKNEFINIPR